MSKPSKITLSVREQKQIMKRYKGSKSEKPVTNARAIATEMHLPRYQVMAFLETQGVKHYSESSYM
jgi:hypothetical protein